MVIELSNIYIYIETLIESARNIVDSWKNFILDSRHSDGKFQQESLEGLRKSGGYPARAGIIETAAWPRRLYRSRGSSSSKLASDRGRNPNRDVAISPTTMASRDKRTRDAVRKVARQNVAEPARTDKKARKPPKLRQIGGQRLRSRSINPDGSLGSLAAVLVRFVASARHMRIVH